jgi:hypothetical protein
MLRQQFPGEQIEQAKGLAATMTNLRDPERFERLASDHQREIDDKCD